jgi:protein TonB
LSATKTTISVATVQGTDEEKGVDIADLEDHKVVIEEKPVYGVEQMPAFPGGEEELIRFIHDNLKYPAVAAEVGVEGRVTIRFVVSRTGDVTDVTVIRGLDPSCDKEAVRVVKMMPRWIPGRQNGRNVPVYYTLPVVFKLQK